MFCAFEAEAGDGAYHDYGLACEIFGAEGRALEDLAWEELGHGGGGGHAGGEVLKR